MTTHHHHHHHHHERLDTMAVTTTLARQRANAVLHDPAVHSLTKDTIRAGLQCDPLDAAKDATLAAEILQAISDEIAGSAASPPAVCYYDYDAQRWVTS